MKIGDKVRILTMWEAPGLCWDSVQKARIGRWGTVTDTFDTTCIVTFPDGRKISFDKRKLDLEEGEFIMEKKDLRTGMIVEIASGAKYLVFVGMWNGQDRLDNSINSKFLTSYEDDLKHKNNSSSDIIAVYKPYSASMIWEFVQKPESLLSNEIDLQTVWRRKSKAEEQIEIVIADLRMQLNDAEAKLKKIQEESK